MHDFADACSSLKARAQHFIRSLPLNPCRHGREKTDIFEFREVVSKQTKLHGNDAIFSAVSVPHT